MKNSFLYSRFDEVRSEVNKINNVLEQILDKPVSSIIEVTDSYVVLTRYINTFIDLQIKLPIDEPHGYFAYDAVIRVQRLYVQMSGDLLKKHGKDIF